jgi:membrane-bound ClpP family serine protease
MKKTIIITLILLCFTALGFAESASSGKSIRPEFYALNVEGIIDISNSDYIVKGIEQAEKDGAG